MFRHKTLLLYRKKKGLQPESHLFPVLEESSFRVKGLRHRGVEFRESSVSQPQDRLPLLRQLLLHFDLSGGDLEGIIGSVQKDP